MLKEGASMKKRTVKMNPNYQSQVRVKQKNKLLIKTFAFTTTVTWPRGLQELKTKTAPFHCALHAGKAIKYGCGPGKVKSHFTNNHSHLSNKNN
jgi:hypothetical protein